MQYLSCFSGTKRNRQNAIARPMRLEEKFGLTYLTDSSHSRINAFTTVYIFYCTFSEEEVNIISYIEGTNKIWLYHWQCHKLIWRNGGDLYLFGAQISVRWHCDLIGLNGAESRVLAGDIGWVLGSWYDEVASVRGFEGSRVGWCLCLHNIWIESNWVVLGWVGLDRIGFFQKRRWSCVFV